MSARRRPLTIALSAALAAWIGVAPTATWAADDEAVPEVSVFERAGEAARGAPLTLEEVYAAVEAHYPVLMAQLADRARADGERMSADGGFDTNLRVSAVGQPFQQYESIRGEVRIDQPTPLWGTSFFAGYRMGLGKFPLYYGDRYTWDAGEVRGGFVIPLWRNGPIDARRAAIRQREIGRDLVEPAVDRVRIDSLRFAAVRYWEWVAAGLRRDIAKDLLAIAEVRDAALAERAQAGDIPRIEVVDNRRLILLRRARLVEARRGLERAAVELSLFFRDEAGRAVIPPAARLPAALGVPPVPDTERVTADLQRAWRTRPEVRRLDLSVKQVRVELALATNQFAPAVDLGVSGAYDMGRRNPVTPRVAGEVGVVVDLPLQFRQARGRIEAAQATLDRIEAEARFARDRIRADVQDALSALRNAEERRRLLAEGYAVTKQVEEAERTLFEAGDSSILIVNLREQATADAASGLVDAELDLRRAEADYAAATAAVINDAADAAGN